MFLISNVWAFNQQRYTGIHQLKADGMVIKNSGVNLDSEEWFVLMENFEAIRELLDGKHGELRGVKRKFDEENENSLITVYTPKWYLNGQPLSKGVSVEYFTYEDARQNGVKSKPEEGIDFGFGAGEPVMQIQTSQRPPMDEPSLMYLVYLYILDKKIKKIITENCEACQVGSDSQLAHAESGNCMDEELDFVKMYFFQGKKGIPTYDLVNVFDSVRYKLGLKRVYSTSLAKAAESWIGEEVLLKDLRKGYSDEYLQPVMDIIKGIADIVIV